MGTTVKKMAGLDRRGLLEQAEKIVGAIETEPWSK
jgi:hypothetical protein